MGEYTTQMDAARKGICTNEMEIVAKKENMDVDKLMGLIAEGKVIMYGDVITGSMRRAIDETERSRAVQLAYNEVHGITPQTVKKDIRKVIEATASVEEQKADFVAVEPSLSPKEIEKRIRMVEKEMRAAAKALEFEKAAILRDELKRLQELNENNQ